MSEIYRDDTMEIAMLTNEAWTTIYHTVEERAHASESVTLGIGLMVIETVRALETISGNRGFINVETARVSDFIFAQRTAAYAATDVAKIKGSPFLKFSEQIEDSAILTDEAFGSTTNFVVERAKAQVTIVAVRLVSTQVSERAHLKDRFFESQSVLLTETAKLVDFAYHKLRTSEFAIDQVQLTDSILAESSSTDWIVEVAKAVEWMGGKLHAASIVDERAFAYEQILDLDLLGSAWVANMDTWAMSRYAPYNFEGAAVLDGELYLWGADGVYLEGVSGEVIYGSLTTGKLDMGEKLTHPLASYLEYQLDGETAEISMSVTSTQSGLPQSFKYHLPKEQAQHLTNGRIVFGRGLRGRHFSYKLEISGTAAEINALSVEHAPTARRI